MSLNHENREGRALLVLAVVAADLLHVAGRSSNAFHERGSRCHMKMIEDYRFFLREENTEQIKRRS